MPIDPSIREHSSYCFQDVVFLVEKTLFKVPRYAFEQHSAIFRDMFALPVDEGNNQEGATKENPLRLEGYSQDDFSQLLRVIYPKHFYPRETLTCDQWISVLKLATMWQFEEARTLAIDTLTTITVDPITRIEHARAYDVRLWYWPALYELGDGENSLRLQDAERLGVEFTLRLAELQGIFKGYKKCSGQIPVVELISSLFADEVQGTDMSAAFGIPTPSPTARPRHNFKVYN